MTTRRAFLRASSTALLGTGLYAPGARALGEGGQVGVGLLDLAADSDDAKEGIRRILWETEKRTSIDTRREVARVSIAGDQLFRHPLVVLSGRGEFNPPSTADAQRLALFLRYGGLLYIDGSDEDAAFWQSVDKTLAAVDLSTKRATATVTKKLPREHVIYKSFFLLPRVVGRADTPDHVYAYTAEGASGQVLMTRCAVLEALARDKVGSWRFDCAPGGGAQREQAIRFGVNLLMYATCSDYKADQVHIPFILKKTRR